MRRTFFTIPSVLLLAVVLFFSSCKKGDTGPAGPAGPTGPGGGAGAQGPKGDTGTANVIYSAWLDVTYQPYVIDTAANPDDTLAYRAVIPAPRLSNAILTSGEIKVYLNFGTAAAPQIDPLPLSDALFGIYISTTFSLQQITLISDLNYSTVTISGVKRLQYRYVLIPGSVPGQKAPKVNWNNYDEVKEYLGLTN